MACVIHDHKDHLGDAFSICRRTNATFMAVVDLAAHAEEESVKDVKGLNVGGSFELDGVKLSMVQATHTATRGVPTGVVAEGEGKGVYHAGDTGLFEDMHLIEQIYKVDVALFPIGGYYTMGAKQASEAVKLLRPKVVIPMHYKAFPVIAQSVDEFFKNSKEKMPQVMVVVLKPGESYSFQFIDNYVLDLEIFGSSDTKSFPPRCRIILAFPKSYSSMNASLSA